MLAEVIFLLFMFFIWRKKKCFRFTETLQVLDTVEYVQKYNMGDSTQTSTCFPTQFWFFYSKLHDPIKNFTVLAGTQKT